MTVGNFGVALVKFTSGVLYVVEIYDVKSSSAIETRLMESITLDPQVARGLD
jgi:hypothetical protein